MFWASFHQELFYQRSRGEYSSDSNKTLALGCDHGRRRDRKARARSSEEESEGKREKVPPFVQQVMHTPTDLGAKNTNDEEERQDGTASPKAPPVELPHVPASPEEIVSPGLFSVSQLPPT